MSEPDREFKRRLLATFRGEAEEHVHSISAGLLELEKAVGVEQGAPIVERIFREAHSLKGAARAVDQREIEEICQSLEAVFARAKRREISLGPEELDVLHAATDEVERALAATREGEGTSRRVERGGLLERLEAISRGGGQGVVPGQSGREQTTASSGREEKTQGVGKGAAAAVAATEETVRVRLSQLDRLLLQVEELVPERWSASLRSSKLEALLAEARAWMGEWAGIRQVQRSLQRSMEPGNGGRRVDAAAVRKLSDFVERSEEHDRRLEQMLSALSRSAAHHEHLLGTKVDSLLVESKQLLLRPFSSILEAFPRLVRDLCRRQEKQADLSLRGAGVEIDRRILQEIKDPLIHLVRNCIDHGIETPEQRSQSGKAPRGVVSIAIEQKSAEKVEIVISDDGAGIDAARVRESAVRLGLVDAEASYRLTAEETYPLIFQSGVSTSSIVTEISGRGLGMVIVREAIERLGGHLAVETRPGKGTTFRVVLPLTVSTVRGVLVRAGSLEAIIPSTFIERVARTSAGEIRTIENRATVLVQDAAVSLVRLGDVMGLPSAEPAQLPQQAMPFVVLAVADRRIAFLVDDVLGELEVLQKSLGPQLARVRNIGGAAVLPTGKLVPILNVSDLMTSALTAAAPTVSRAPEGRERERRRKSILVVDDSITARTLLKNILEAAGYHVRTAVDGAEAFASLRETEVDVVVSDVDMPRLNGFDLTAKIRADKRIADLPVILVTALESREDRERGIEAGANAYIVKSSFEQGNLLEIVRRYA